MRERREIVKLWERAGSALTAMATLVRVQGSSYRHVGARLLIAADGTYVGSISGGCLEAEIVRKAQWLVRDGACIQRYSTLFDDTAEIPYGLGCGGTVDVLLEPADTSQFEALMQAMARSLRGEAQMVETRLPNAEKKLERLVRSCDGGPAELPESGSANTFVELLVPPQRLVVFGAGDDAKPLVQMSALLGWSVVVIDGRAQWARSERFPEAEQVCSVSADGPLDIRSKDLVVIMTHSYEQDRAWLVRALKQRPRYLGLLGARHRSALLVKEAAALLEWPLERVCEHLFAPVGLDLGGDGAEAIALATVAEMQACCEGKLGESRRMTPELVDEQIARGGASLFLQQCAL